MIHVTTLVVICYSTRSERLNEIKHSINDVTFSYGFTILCATDRLTGSSDKSISMPFFTEFSQSDPWSES